MSALRKNTKCVEYDRHSAAARKVDCSSSRGGGTGHAPPDDGDDGDDDEYDEEDFIKIYFASGTVLRPSDEPYELRAKIDRANRELARDNDDAVANAPGKVKFDDTVVVLDSFEDVGTVPVGTERLQGAADAFPGRNDPADQSRNDEDDQNDVVVCSAADGTRHTAADETADEAADEAAHSSASFSRSFSSESDDPPYIINVIESGDEFKTIMDRNNRTRQGSAIDEHVTYFPELFTHAQYKIYEKSGGKTSGDGGGGDDSADIYVPKKLDADELRNKLKEISKGTNGVKKASANGPARKPTAGGGSCRKTKPTDRNRAARRLPPPPAPAVAPPRPGRRHGKARVTYYFELDPKGKLRPLSAGPHASGKFFRIDLKATGGGGGNAAGGRARATDAPADTDLFLEFGADGSGDGGAAAKLVIKKKPADNKSAERPRLPGYNGLRSEYGLSAEQLLERRRMKTERETRRKESRQRRHEEEQKRRAANEKNFYGWLQQKRQANKPSKAARHSYPTNRLTVPSSAENPSVQVVNFGHRRKRSFALEDLLKIKDENDGWLKF